jgi:hypothetical protein
LLHLVYPRPFGFYLCLTVSRILPHPLAFSLHAGLEQYQGISPSLAATKGDKVHEVYRRALSSRYHNVTGSEVYSLLDEPTSPSNLFAGGKPGPIPRPHEGQSQARSKQQIRRACFRHDRLLGRHTRTRLAGLSHRLRSHRISVTGRHRRASWNSTGSRVLSSHLIATPIIRLSASPSSRMARIPDVGVV